MQRLILKMTIAIAGLIGPIVQASELEKNELDEVVTFATNLGIYDCYGFKGAYDHPEMNQVYTVGKHSTRIPQVTCRFNAYEGGKCVIFEHVNGLKAADYGSPRGCERNV